MKLIIKNETIYKQSGQHWLKAAKGANDYMNESQRRLLYQTIMTKVNHLNTIIVTVGNVITINAYTLK